MAALLIVVAWLGYHVTNPSQTAPSPWLRATVDLPLPDRTKVTAAFTRCPAKNDGDQTYCNSIIGDFKLTILAEHVIEDLNSCHITRRNCGDGRHRKNRNGA